MITGGVAVDASTIGPAVIAVRHGLHPVQSPGLHFFIGVAQWNAVLPFGPGIGANGSGSVLVPDCEQTFAEAIRKGFQPLTLVGFQIHGLAVIAGLTDIGIAGLLDAGAVGHLKGVSVTGGGQDGFFFVATIGAGPLDKAIGGAGGGNGGLDTVVVP